MKRWFQTYLHAFSGFARAPVRRVYLKQVYFTANEAAWLMFFIGFALGGIVVTQLHDQYGQSRDNAMRLLASLTFGELAPLLTVLIVMARSASAIAIEMASMRVTGEVRELERMNISIVSYLVLPRVLGMMSSAVLLTACMALGAMLGGVIFIAGWDASYQVLAIERVLRMNDVLLCLAKAASFGLAGGILACHSGLNVQLSATEIPKSASRAVMRGLFALFALDLIWAIVR
ncbi:ABC transporter permease [Chitinibacter bivalviorum]|uniref:ABC transporter permease n=1 Tax=Chitinibacter bivalviorum TaxID=2739434 RepID=A0A7H9BI00_9NEIS|nr:ABC transporter permease [Chitinibacter bivalviorum]QLG87896.1 ABC transporter permease [Chitinibacter bivalviorum]